MEGFQGMEEVEGIVEVPEVTTIAPNLGVQGGRVLSAIKINVSTVMSDELLNQLSVDLRHDCIASQLSAQLTGVVYANVDVIERHVLVPKTWWDHLKLTIRNRFNCFYWMTVVVDQIDTQVTNKRVCPHIKGVYNEKIHLNFLESGK